MSADHKPYLEVLHALRLIPRVKKVFIRSGIRFDYIDLDNAHGREFIETLCRHHISGQLKVAPEHISPSVLAAMGKGTKEAYIKFTQVFKQINQDLGLKQFLIPYFMASHPGSTLKDALELALFLKQEQFIPDQMQDFYPTPGSLATVMYRCGLDPRSMKPIHVPTAERKLQRALMQCKHPANKAAVKEALQKLGRSDLIGSGPKCLVK